MRERQYLAVDLKSFYASVECVERGLNPMTTHLVVADLSRTEKTICLAVTPSLKAYGISGRARLFEVVEKVRIINAHRLSQAPGQRFSGASSSESELNLHPELALDYIVAPPRMAKYMEWSARIYQVYLKYVAPEDIHVYSIDEVFMDITNYLAASGHTPRSFAKAVVQDVLRTTGITATAGIGTNLYLAKVAMDIMAKRIPPDIDGVRIAELNEMNYRQLLWDHRPLTDFWRMETGYARKLEANGLYTMGDIARCSTGASMEFHNEDLLYKLFGVNAELLIDHAWGWEPCTIAEIKAYRPESNSIGSGQVLHRPYSFHQARLVVWEMADALSLDLVEKGLVTDQLTLTVGYDMENLVDPMRQKQYQGEIKTDHYGRAIPKHAHSTSNLGRHTASAKAILAAFRELFDRIADPNLLIRRLTLTANHVIKADDVPSASGEQLDLFTNFKALEEQRLQEVAALEKEQRLQRTVLGIKRRYGKNAILRGPNLLDGATARNRNRQIGGHRA